MLVPCGNDWEDLGFSLGYLGESEGESAAVVCFGLVLELEWTMSVNSRLVQPKALPEILLEDSRHASLILMVIIHYILVVDEEAGGMVRRSGHIVDRLPFHRQAFAYYSSHPLMVSIAGPHNSVHSRIQGKHLDLGTLHQDRCLVNQAVR